MKTQENSVSREISIIDKLLQVIDLENEIDEEFYKWLDNTDTNYDDIRNNLNLTQTEFKNKLHYQTFRPFEIYKTLRAFL